MHGIKYDSDKPEYHLIPPTALEAMAKVLTYGKQKYSAWNWTGLEKHRLFSAAQRHLWQMAKGNRVDPETGFEHIDHALCNLAMLKELEQRRTHESLTERPQQGTSVTDVIGSLAGDVSEQEVQEMVDELNHDK